MANAIAVLHSKISYYLFSTNMIKVREGEDKIYINN